MLFLLILRDEISAIIVETHTVNYNLKNIISDKEIAIRSSYSNFRITASDGKVYNTKYYMLGTEIGIHAHYSTPNALNTASSGD